MTIDRSLISPICCALDTNDLDRVAICIVKLTIYRLLLINHIIAFCYAKIIGSIVEKKGRLKFCVVVKTIS